MNKVLRAGAVALATLACFHLADRMGATPAAAQDVALTESHIARLKSVLKLTPAQEPHWRQVEAALRQIIREQRRDEVIKASMLPIGSRASNFTVNAMAIRRIAAAARPLIESLDAEQKQAGLTALRTMGVAALF